MNKEDIDLLVEQIRQIILNKPIKEELKSESEELAELQEAVLYLSGLLSESNEFLKHLQAGELDVKPPGRHNFLAGNLKELHSALKHLTWQANQIANGDYSQKVDFLGDFSASFNSMIHQLAEREAKLKHQSVELSDMVELIKSIVDGLKDWIVVIDSESDEIIYTNQSANQLFYDMEIEKNTCGKKCELIEQLRKQSQDCKNSIFEYTCPKSMKILRVKSFGIKWNNKAACVHCIQDVTDECEYHEQVEEMAYTDELTGLYNRRYCMKQLERQLSQKNEFSFCMIDLDGLKYANDNYGHASGDRYLKTVADEMLKISRTTDIVCRIGGDEFAILFLNCASDIALKKMKQANLSIESLSEGFLMSISYGVIHIEAGMNISPETILKWADKKMYALKNIQGATADDMVCVPAVEGDSFVNILSVMMNSSVNRLKRWEDNKLDFFGNSISLSGRVLDYLWQKNGMIAANIANNDTPGYKSRYMTFEDVLKRNLERVRNGSSSDIRKAIGNTRGVIHTTEQESVRIDGNNVQIEAEYLEQARVQLQYEYQLKLLNSELSQLRTAIKG